ncbi:aminotransferase class I/II-fold pyridoxal phosphate-dependent enzyme [Xanthobacteraceae bacterium A53D]
MRKTAVATPARPAAVAAPVRDVAFDTLPGFRMMKTQRAAADMLGLRNPFYNLHEDRAGARTRMGGQSLLNFASYDYLGLNGHPEITAAVAEAAGTWGTSVSASRLTAGERPFHREFEQALAGVYGAEDALVFVGGHATNISCIAALVGPKDLVIHDALAHNSIVVGAELSKANRRIFAHNDLDALEDILAAARDKHDRCLIVTEGLFSMDGDGPDLARLIEIKRRWGAWLMMDEAHSLGVLGATGRGIFEHQGVDPSGVDIWMGTLSKSLVGCGGYIAGSSDLVTFLKFQAPGMVYSVGLPATLTIGSLTALRLMLREPERVARLQANGQRFLDKARAAGLDVGDSWGYAVSPVIIGDSLRTVMLADRLLARGINAFPIIPPGVPEKSARLRFFISAAHTGEEIDTAVAAVTEELARLEAEGVSVANVASLMT